MQDLARKRASPGFPHRGNNAMIVPGHIFFPSRVVDGDAVSEMYILTAPWPSPVIPAEILNSRRGF